MLTYRLSSKPLEAQEPGSPTGWGAGQGGRCPGRGVRHVGVAAPDPGPLRQPRLLLAKLLRGHRLRVRDSLLLVVAVVPRVLKCSKFLVVNSNHCNLEELITISPCKISLARPELELRTESVVVGGSRLHVDAGDLPLGVPRSHSPPSHTGISAGSFTSLMQHFSQEPQNA